MDRAESILARRAWLASTVALALSPLSYAWIPLAGPGTLNGSSSSCLSLRSALCSSPAGRSGLASARGARIQARASPLGDGPRGTTVNRTDCAIRSAKPFMIRFVTGLRRPKNRIPGMELADSVRYEAGNCHAVAVVDLDGGGILDVLSGSYEHTKVWFWRGTGDGGFIGTQGIDAFPDVALGLAAADFDNDGALDLAVSSSGARGVVSILLRQ
ncbi:MAG: VCBS repeat-containing protein [Chloroflexi bacterium]|nr:VCBS repeat-containing protein [Chloroflexota bacterium]